MSRGEKIQILQKNPGRKAYEDEYISGLSRELLVEPEIKKGLGSYSFNLDLGYWQLKLLPFLFLFLWWSP